MKNAELIAVFEKLEQRINSVVKSENSKRRFLHDILELKKEFTYLDIPEAQTKVYESLIAKGKGLKLEEKKNPEVRYFIDYCNAALSDFTGKSSEIRTFYRCFLVMSILYLACSPMWLGAIGALIFLVPIFFASKGIKNRVKTGYLLSCCILPVSLAVGSMWAMNGINVFANREAQISGIVASSAQRAADGSITYGISPEFASILSIAGPILGIGLLVACVFFIIKALNVRRMFV